MTIFEVSAGVSSYALLRKLLEVVLDEGLNYQPIKSWPFSSWIISILHDLVIVPTLTYTGSSVDSIYITTCSYYLADFVWFARSKSFQGLFYHHVATILIIAIALVHFNQETRNRYCSNILYMTIGSGILNLRGVLRATRKQSLPDYIYAMLYLTTRLLVIKSLKEASRFEMAISAPLLAHNFSIVYKLLNRQR